FFFYDTSRPAIYTLSLHDALPIFTVVNNPDADNAAPTVLGTFRTGEATMFSWDVAVQKARTAVFYSRHNFLNFGLNSAMSTRCVDRKSTRLNSSHRTISYAVFCLK